MATPILRRFIIGYSVMLILMVAVSGYSIFQLGKLSDAAHVALSIEQRMIDKAERLADTFLSEVRYAGKFGVTQSPVHNEQYMQFNADFNRNIGELKVLVVSPDPAQRLSRVEEYHAQYQQLFEREVEYIKIRQPYAETRYREEKERLVDYLLRENEAIKSDLQNSMQQRIGYIEKAALETQKFTIAATLLLIGLGFFLAYCLSGRVPFRQQILARAKAVPLCLRSMSWWKGLAVPR
jgi:CHASE3 domain sensor protein